MRVMGHEHDSTRKDLGGRLDLLEAKVNARSRATGGLLNRALKYLPLLVLSNLLIAAPAFLISIAVAYFTFKQAEATEKMQIATVWPNIAYDTGNLSDDGEPRITLSVTNRGVGPAIVRGMEVSYQGKAYRDVHSLLRACCAKPEEPIALVLSSVNGEVIRAGDEINFAQVEPGGVSPTLFRRFDEARLELHARVCYCSVFDECWVEDSRSTIPLPVEICPADWTQFGFPSGIPARR